MYVSYITRKTVDHRQDLGNRYEYDIKYDPLRVAGFEAEVQQAVIFFIP